MKKKFFLTLFIFLALLLTVGLIYLNNVFLPVKVKQIAIEQAEKFLHRKVTLGNLQFSPVKGLVLADLTVAEKGSPDKIFVQIKRASGNILLWPFLKEKKIIIPAIVIESPRISVSRTNHSEFNFSDLIIPKPQPDKKPAAQGIPDILITQLVIQDGRIDFRDETTTPPFAQSLDGIQVKAGLVLPQDINVSLQLNLPRVSRPAFLNLDGKYNLSSKILNATVDMKNLPAVELVSIYYQPPMVELKSGFVESAHATIDAQGPKIQARGEAVLSDLMGKLNSGIEFAGDPKISFNLSNDPSLDTKSSYDLTINLNRAKLTGLPYIEEAKDLTGRVFLQPDNVRVEALSAALLNSSAKVDGTLENFQDPSLDIQGETGLFDLALVKKFIPEIIEKIQIDARGQAQAQFTFKGKIKDAAKADVNLTAQLKDANINHPKLPAPFKNIDGEVHYDAGGLSWKDLSVDFLEQGFTSNGHLTNFTMPDLTADITSKNLTLSAAVKAVTNGYEIKTCQGRYFNSAVDVTGKILLPKEAPAVIDAAGNVNLALEDLAKIYPPLKDKLKDIRPSGLVTIKGAVQGPLQDPFELNINASAQSDSVSVAGYRLNHFALDVQQSPGQQTQLNLTADTYGGQLSAIAAGKLTETFPFSLRATLDRLDLAKLKTDVASLKGKDISGLLSTSWDIEGEAKDLNTILGRGTLAVADGNLWQLNLLEGLGVLLFIPEFSKISFTGVEGTFTVAEQKVSTENLTLNSEEVGVVAKGWVDFVGKLNFNIAAHFSEKAIAESSSIKKGFTAILTQANNYLSIKLSGTLKDPRYTIIPLPVTILEETGNIIREGLQNIFQ